MLKTIGPVLAHTIIYPIMSKVNIHICKYENHLQFRDCGANLRHQEGTLVYGMREPVGHVLSKINNDPTGKGWYIHPCEGD